MEFFYALNWLIASLVLDFSLTTSGALHLLSTQAYILLKTLYTQFDHAMNCIKRKLHVFPFALSVILQMLPF